MTATETAARLAALLAEYGALWRGVRSLFTAGVVYLLGRLVVVRGGRRVVRARNRNNPTLASAAETYLHLVVAGLALLAGAAGAGYSRLLTDTALVVAAVTVVAGVAGREVLGALVSGVFLVADPDFNVGDWIAWPDGEGVVEAVDFRVTRVRTVDNETVTVPNTVLTNHALRRPYGRDRYRVTERVEVAYDDDAERALMTLAAAAGEDDRVLAEPGPTARLVEFGATGVVLRAEFWVADPMDVDLVDLRSTFRRRTKRRFDEAGLTLGPPATREVSGRLTVEREA